MKMMTAERVLEVILTPAKKQSTTDYTDKTDKRGRNIERGYVGTGTDLLFPIRVIRVIRG
jgi:hypothetical protein